MAALTLIANAGSSSFGGFVGSASESVTASADSLVNHVTVTPGEAGKLELHNPTSEAQRLQLWLVGSPAGVSASFHSSGAGQSTLAAGGSDAVEVTGPGPGTAQVSIAVLRTSGAPFPSASFPVQLTVAPAAP